MAEICPVELPGRGTRSAEPLAAGMGELLEAAAAAILSVPDERPIALFGHSLGAYIAADLAGLLSARCRAPSHLFLSAAVRPDLMERPHAPEALDDALLGELSEGGNLPQEAMLGRWADALALLRADLSLIDTPNVAELEVPVTVFSGTRDRIAPPERVDAWRSLCSAGFFHHRLDDTHLYLRRRRDEILDAIDLALSKGKVVPSAA
jgi:surfactin synthase thioesterase subunit